MNRKEKADRLSTLIQQSGIDKPSSDFTAIVMKEVMAKEEAVINPGLKSLLNKSTIEIASPEFTRQVMMKIEAHEFKSAQPIISKRTWYIAAAAMALLVFYIGFSGQSTTDSGNLAPYLNVMGQSVTSLFNSISSISPLYTIVFISLGGLVVLDYFLRVKTQNQDKKILS